MRALLLILSFPFALCGQLQKEVRFEIKNLGSTVEGQFEEFSLDIQWNESNPLTSKISGSVQVESINTGIGLRDRHLRSSSYFDAKKFPTITFKARKIEQTAGRDEYKVIGLLTIKDISREETFTLHIDERGREIFTTIIDRRKYRVGGKSITMGDEVKVTVID
ncbi:YceI family protein [Schleiferia thermophila]|jgi:polyisoprenoid-binding protein YceI|uniref:YceI family protein n=1 Tax=Schleiferia thermophila TaxID=884107 RepID=UPI0004E79906|nr:YceI family protein [Schleiferia thermophila]KFD38582.1 hypothetical protein AT05_09130 [Schleiferia thermophila str. Yellowstone]